MRPHRQQRSLDELRVGAAHPGRLLTCRGHPGTTVPDAVRSVDILPTVLREMQIPVTHWMDGRRFPVP